MPRSISTVQGELIAKAGDGEVITLTTGQAQNFDARGLVRLTVITGTGATATVSRVDSAAATDHTAGTENQFTVAATTHTMTDVDWPFFRVSVSGGSCRVALV